MDLLSEYRAKLKTAEKELTRQISLGEQELHYLKSVLEELNRAQTDGELEEIKQELQQGGYLRHDGGKRKMKQAKSKPLNLLLTSVVNLLKNIIHSVSKRSVPPEHCPKLPLSVSVCSVRRWH